MTPEKVVQSKIMSYLADLIKAGHPLVCDRRQAGGFNYKMGIPDLWAVYDGIHFEIEVKAPGGELRPMQEKYRDRCKRKNILWTCSDSIQQFKQTMEEYFHVSERTVIARTPDDEELLFLRVEETGTAQRSNINMEQIKRELQGR